ncbi:Helix-turn-helix, AraC type:periplasmic binding protein [Pseudomonas syringae pv. philadelphi]|uniref:Helix-turn-helix, AraC type:periplasmic binding protein n=1 Tax=Pseudomonas syringae pv. philadelphi TaxID=251706 RepID=A0A3M3ZW12_9PSED|nr:Helix-turn-helix, AraC type:periplasmic binding protein [Pseudomonas syringae pv. philadelphi]
MHRIALLFNGSKIYDRGIISGIGNYLSSTRVSWDLFLEEDFLCRLKGIERWQGDGIIADFDDPLIGEALAGIRLPVVAVGGSYQDARAYPKGIPYVATDNHALIEAAYQHLIEAGLTRFACFSLPEAQANRWAQERETAFRRLLQRDGRRSGRQPFAGCCSAMGCRSRSTVAWAPALRFGTVPSNSRSPGCTACPNPSASLP